ncbi:GNAT family N-acetyltransferase [Arcanobacterium hippocoleae]|uniref:GNAT family acetyltransferase n=1 Tax=Arcanobacterium hippocoleae TaxID=149017 RepID=A0ABU1T2K6_9ACTO|nr:GNAT family N-acetyltransferase [Arcanobacterium hippocoleae]MDR6939609.1 putative GNAT family acetyltransferase [Arcanobacterium hippocoleae]
MNDEAAYEIVNNEPRGQWELRLAPDDRVIGYLSYDLNEEEIFFTHTVIHKDFQGRGLAGELVRTALDFEKEQGVRKIVPICSYVQKFVADNPGYPVAE